MTVNEEDVMRRSAILQWNRGVQLPASRSGQCKQMIFKYLWKNVTLEQSDFDFGGSYKYKNHPSNCCNLPNIYQVFIVYGGRCWLHGLQLHNWFGRVTSLRGQDPLVVVSSPIFALLSGFNKVDVTNHLIFRRDWNSVLNSF